MKPAGCWVTYPEGPQGVVRRVHLLPAAPVHQALQLDQEELLGSGEVRGEGGASGVGETPGPSLGKLAGGPARAGGSTQGVRSEPQGYTREGLGTEHLGLNPASGTDSSWYWGKVA